MVLGFVNDKAVEKLLQLFPANATFYLATPDIPRALPLLDLEKIAIKLNLNYTIFPSVVDAMSRAQAMAMPEDFIYVGGSTFVVAEII